MRKIIKMLGLSIALLSMPAGAKVAEPTECPSGTFKCYCNSSFVGCVTTIQYCINACGSALQSDPDQSVVAEKNSCSEAVDEKDQTVFVCSSENPASE